MGQPVLNYGVVRSLPRLRTTTIALLVVLVVTLLTFVAMGVSGALSARLWRQYADGLGLDPAEVALANGSREVGQFAFLGLPGTFIPLLFWMAGAQRNLRTLARGRLRFSWTDVITGWILPRAFVVRPFEVMKEIYALSLGRRRDSFAPLCGCWWGFWLTANAVALAGALACSHTELRGADAQIYYATWEVLRAVPYLISGACLGVMAYRTDRGHARRGSADL